MKYFTTIIKNYDQLVSSEISDFKNWYKKSRSKKILDYKSKKYYKLYSHYHKIHLFIKIKLPFLFTKEYEIGVLYRLCELKIYEDGSSEYTDLGLGKNSRIEIKGVEGVGELDPNKDILKSQRDIYLKDLDNERD